LQECWPCGLCAMEHRLIVCAPPGEFSSAVWRGRLNCERSGLQTRPGPQAGACVLAREVNQSDFREGMAYFSR
jgi:hypothetical protein